MRDSACQVMFGGSLSPSGNWQWTATRMDTLACNALYTTHCLDVSWTLEGKPNSAKLQASSIDDSAASQERLCCALVTSTSLVVVLLCSIHQTAAPARL